MTQNIFLQKCVFKFSPQKCSISMIHCLNHFHYDPTVDRVSEDNYYSSPRHPAAEPLWLALPDKHRALRNIRLKCKIWQQQLFETWYTYIGSTRTVIQFELDTEQKQALPLPHNTIQCRAIWGSVFCQRGFLKLTNRGKGCNYLFAVNSRVKSPPEQPQNSS